MQGWESSCEILGDVVKLGLLDSALEDASEMLWRQFGGTSRRWVFFDDGSAWGEFCGARLEGHAFKIIE